MKKVFATLALCAVAGFVVAAEMKSGPQEGEKLPGPFHPLNVNGDKAGEKACLYCKHGDNPVAMVFARTPDCPMTAKLIKRLEAATKEHEKAEMGCFVVFCSDEDKIAEKLKQWTDKEGIKHVTLAVDNPSGPAKYKIEKDADLTIILYTDRTVKANWAFKKGEIKDEHIDTIIKGLSKIVPAK